MGTFQFHYLFEIWHTEMSVVWCSNDILDNDFGPAYSSDNAGDGPELSPEDKEILSSANNRKLFFMRLLK